MTMHTTAMSPILEKEASCRQILQHQDAMFRTAKAILRNDQDAEAAVQEAICAAYTARATLREMDKCKPWLLRILANRCYDMYRKRKQTVDLAQVQEILPAGETDPTEGLALWQAVMALDDTLRAPVTLFYYDGLSVREISEILGISQPAVKTRLSRGRERLRRMLREE